jgi:hypothetical protein
VAEHKGWHRYQWTDTKPAVASCFFQSNARDDKDSASHTTRWGGESMPGRTRKTSRQFEKDKAAFFNQCKAQHAVCWLCGMPIDYSAPKNTSDDSFNLDHLYPVSKHPELQFDPAGFKPSHTSCNRLRGNQDPPAPIGTLSRQWITTA